MINTRIGGREQVLTVPVPVIMDTQNNQWLYVVSSRSYEEYTASEAFKENLLFAGLRGLAACRKSTDSSMCNMKQLLVRIAILKELGSAFTGIMDPHFTDELLFASLSPDAAIAGLDEEVGLLESELKWALEHVEGAVTLQFLTEYVMVQTLHHCGSARMSTAFMTAITVCAGIASPFDQSQQKPDNIIYKLVCTIDDSPVEDGVLDDRLPPAPAGTHAPLVAVAALEKAETCGTKGSVAYIAQESRLVAHLAKGLDLGMVAGAAHRYRLYDSGVEYTAGLWSQKDSGCEGLVAELHTLPTALGGTLAGALVPSRTERVTTRGVTLTMRIHGGEQRLMKLTLEAISSIGLGSADG